MTIRPENSHPMNNIMRIEAAMRKKCKGAQYGHAAYRSKEQMITIAVNCADNVCAHDYPSDANKQKMILSANIRGVRNVHYRTCTTYSLLN